MKDASNHATHNYDAEQHLAVVRALCTAVDGAHAALAGGRLEDLTRHIAEQADLSARLASILPVATPVKTAAVRLNPSLPLVSAEAREAHLQLARRVRRLAALLRHCGRSADLLSANCQFFLGGIAAQPATQRRWSTEV
jgi:hypothetical protein